MTIDAAEILDLGDPAVVADPYPAYAALRRGGPVWWHSGLRCWIAVDHAAASAVLRDRRLGRTFQPRPGGQWASFNALHTGSMIENEPPQHSRLRRLVSGAFTRGRVEALAPRIAAIATELLDLDDPDLDLIGGYAEPLSVLVICALLGVPAADRQRLRDWSQRIVRMYEPDPPEADQLAATRAADEFTAYVTELAALRAREPGDDLVSALVSARHAGDRLSADELVATVVLLLNAGHEASVNGFGNGLVSYLAAGRPPVEIGDEVATVRLVEEMLRHDAPLQLFERTAGAEVEIGGAVLRPGDRIAALLGAANRDPAVFADPDRFDPARDPNPQLSFGAGIHFCLGAPLARLELRIAVATLLARRPRLRLVQAEQRDTFVLRGFHRLVVVG